MASNQGGKGNPASHRMGNPKRKARRERSWLRGEKRHKANQERQEAAAAHNRELRAAGELTPWEQAKAKRAERRKNKSKGKAA